ncbi:MAG TPA: metallophosphoesterase [Candidatus Acidoferrum sp.]|nr:metallophosphoesterase [Candidatus Acidoferrum sp.]
MISFLSAHKRVITYSLVAFGAFWLAPSLREAGPLFFLIFFAILVMLIASQLLWIRRVGELGKRMIPSKRWRNGLGAVGLLVYLFLLAFNLFTWNTESNKGSGLTPRAALLEAPLWLWLVGSFFGFLIAILLGTFDRVARVMSWAFRKFIRTRPDLWSPGRRRFLEQTAIAISAAPFVGGTYGLFYGRLNLETVRQRIRLGRLPKAFEGFRIVQLSDLHISPFMSAEEIRRYVAIANQLKGDLVALTGDFLTWDPAAQGAVVQELSALKAPFGVFGCLGNHEIYTETQDSITRLFAAEGINILRTARMPLQTGDEVLNLIGVDFQGNHDGPDWPQSAYLRGVERLMMPDTANILLSHNPNSFDRAAELGIDLTLAGHTHGGQLSLESLHRGLCLSRFETRYVSGWYEKTGSQIYVNRGIGTIGFPIRLGARPEITVFELTREG